MSKYPRGKISNLVSLLSGRDFTTKTYDQSVVEDTYENVAAGLKNFTSEYNFKEFLICMTSIGFRNPKQITSNLTVDFAYALFLKARDENKDIDKVKAYIGRWYVMSNLTGRYSNSTESTMDRDLRMIRDKTLARYLEEIESAELTDSFWGVSLVQSLETSRYSNPLFYTFLAAQIMSNDNSLLSQSSKVTDLIDVEIGEMHHVFPQAYLRKNGYDSNKYNQIANYVYIDKSVNNAISDRSPKEYFGMVVEQCRTKELKIGDISNLEDLKQNLKANCIPEDIVHMEHSDYETFLLERRKLIAERLHEYYDKIKSRC